MDDPLPLPPFPDDPTPTPTPTPTQPGGGGTMLMDLMALSNTDRMRALTRPTERCAECAAVVKMGQRFCFHCGTPVALQCPRCQAAARTSDKFCLSCGTPLHGSAVILR